MNQTCTKTAFQICKNLLYELADRFIYVMKDKRAEANLSDLLPFKIAEVVIGGTIYAKEITTAVFQGKPITVTHHTPVLTPEQRAKRKKEIEHELFDVFVKNDKKGRRVG